MKLLYGENKFFIGAIKFFDVKKGFGYVASNNCNMPTKRYKQDFYVDSSSFIEEGAKKEGRVVVFQVGKQGDGKKKAVNVRRITKSNEDVNLALSYYGDYEYIEFNDERKVNLYSHTYKPRKLVVEKVQSIILNDEKRSPQTTAQHFSFLVGHYKKEENSKEQYIFDRDFSDENKSIWVSLFATFTDDECIEVLNVYPSVSRYFNNINLLLKWLNNYFTDDCSLSKLQDVKETFGYLPEKCVTVAKEQLESIVDIRIKEILSKLSKRSDIDEDAFDGCFGEIGTEEPNELSKSDIDEDALLDDCFGEIRTEKLCWLSLYPDFDDVFYDWPDNTQHIPHLETLRSYFLLTSKKYEKEKKQCLIAVRNNKLQIELAKFVSHPYDYNVRKTLFQVLDTMPKEELKVRREELKNTIISILDGFIGNKSHSNAISLLTELASLSSEPISTPKILSIAQRIIFSWSFETIKEIIGDKAVIFNNDLRFIEMVIERAVQLVGDIPLTRFFDGSSIEYQQILNEWVPSRLPEEDNCSFLNNLKKLIPAGTESNLWNDYVNSRSAEDLLIMYYKEVITTLPESIIEKVVNSTSLGSVYINDGNWYDKPILKNLAYKKALETTPVNLFPLIAKRLVQLDLSKNNIPLAVLLAELMTCNKPDSGDIEWEKQFKLQLTDLKDANPSNTRLSVVLWAVHSRTTTSMAALGEIFVYLPPYIQIRAVKKLFQLIDQKKIKHSADSLYKLISQTGKPICLPLEIAFDYLKRREINPSATLDNNIMLQLFDGRDDHAEWIGIRELVTECFGRWEIIAPQKRYNNYFNGIIGKAGEKIRVFVPAKTVDVNGIPTYYDNRSYLNVVEQIRMTYTNTDYQVVNEPQGGISYYFDESFETELLAIAHLFKFKFNDFGNNFDVKKNENENNMFCECRLSNKVDKRSGIAFYWCRNKPCFRPLVRYRRNDEWEDYTLLDFMRILNIPTDYINRAGQKTMFGHYIILLSFLKSFAKFYEHLKCRNCGELMKPLDITNFAAYSVTKFSCKNECCAECGKIVYLNHCFNKQKCNATIDSRDSKTCPNGQYICPECGACCSTENTRLRINNLKKTGGHIDDRLINFVHHNMGHWEKMEFFCYKCGKAMLSLSRGHYECPNCNTKYDHS